MFHHPDTVYQMDVARRRIAAEAAQADTATRQGEPKNRMRIRFPRLRTEDTVPTTP